MTLTYLAFFTILAAAVFCIYEMHKSLKVSEKEHYVKVGNRYKLLKKELHHLYK